VILVLLALAGVAVGVPLGVYGRWSGWGFGLGWWGTPTPARVLEVTPLTGAVLTGHSDQSLVEQRHRVDLRLSVELPDGEAYEASTIAWQEAGDDLTGRTLVARVSRTRPQRVYVPKDAPDAAAEDGRY
jgi:hypothetical protein